MKSRWQIIQKSCNKFRGYLRTIEALHRSGMARPNEYDAAKQTYFVDTGKYCGMDGCWAIIKNSIKWQDINPSENKSKNHVDTEVPITCESPEPETIPLLKCMMLISKKASGALAIAYKNLQFKKLWLLVWFRKSEMFVI